MPLPGLRLRLSTASARVVGYSIPAATAKSRRSSISKTEPNPAKPATDGRPALQVAQNQASVQRAELHVAVWQPTFLEYWPCVLPGRGLSHRLRLHRNAVRERVKDGGFVVRTWRRHIALQARASNRQPLSVSKAIYCIWDRACIHT